VIDQTGPIRWRHLPAGANRVVSLLPMMVNLFDHQRLDAFIILAAIR
jgi:hypothetical protein